jgi:hypothetical protein
MLVIQVGHPPKEWEGCESHLVRFHNFASLPSEKSKCVKSLEFSSFGQEWKVYIFPGGDKKAEEGNISLYLYHCSKGDVSVQHNVLIKKFSGKAVIDTAHKFAGMPFAGISLRGWSNAGICNVIMNTKVLNNGSLTVDVCIKPEDGDCC